jgi:sugar phosphate isomerase/epimerase
MKRGAQEGLADKAESQDAGPQLSRKEKTPAKMPRIFVSTSCLGGTRRLHEILSVYSSHGIENVELSGGLDYIEDIDDVLNQHSHMMFVVHNYFPPAKVPFIMNLAAQDEGVRRRSIGIAKGAVELCHNCGLGLYSFHPGFRQEKSLELGFELSLSPIVPYERAFRTFCRSVEEILEVSKRLGVDIAVENLEHKNQAYMMTRPEEFLRFQEMFPEVGVLLDLGHLKIASRRLGFNVTDFLRAVRDNLLEVHIHENDCQLDLHKEPLSGDVMRLLGTVDCETIALECHNLNIERILLNLRALEQSFI